MNEWTLFIVDNVVSGHPVSRAKGLMYKMLDYTKYNWIIIEYQK